MEVIESWKRSAERFAAIDLSILQAESSGNQLDFAKAERLMPTLFEEMRKDLLTYPTVREAVVLSKKWSYNSSGRLIFFYFFEDHDDLERKFDVLDNLGFVAKITDNNVRRYRIKEELVDYLTG